MKVVGRAMTSKRQEHLFYAFRQFSATMWIKNGDCEEWVDIFVPIESNMPALHWVSGLMSRPGANLLGSRARGTQERHFRRDRTPSCGAI